MVRLVPPEFVSVAAWLWLVPTWTFPKLRLAGATASTPDVVPMPDILTLTVSVVVLLDVFKLVCTKRTLVDREALPPAVIVPLAEPLVCGVKTTLKLVLCPGLKVSGRVRPLIWKPAPLTVACEMVRLDAPEFVKVSVFVALSPTFTLPKVRVDGLALS